MIKKGVVSHKVNGKLMPLLIRTGHMEFPVFLTFAFTQQPR